MKNMKNMKQYEKIETNEIFRYGIEDGEASLYHGEEHEIFSINTAAMFGLVGKMKIDLMKINIEGAEYAVILDMIDRGIIQKVDNIQVQFHDIGKPGEYEKIKEKLLLTHKQTWWVPFVWENWERL